MLIGTVKWFNIARASGLCIVTDGYKSLAEGPHVTFETEGDPKNKSRLRAVNVRPA